MVNNSKALDRLFYSMPIEKLKDDKLHYIDLHIIDGCNHNCARCVKYAPLCKKLGLVDKDTLTADLKQLAKVTNHRMDGISIIGGEPLISPDVNYYMLLCRKLFPDCAITIVTNGLAIPQMSDEFFKIAKICNVWFAISKFYDDEYYTNIIKKLEEQSCADRYSFSKLEPFGCVMFVQMDLDETGSQNPELMFEKCPNKNGYITLKDGKLWSCPTACMKYILNDYFKTDFKYYPEDGISVYGHTEKEIVEFLKKPKKSCRYCTECGLNRMYFPEATKRDKSEWIKKC